MGTDRSTECDRGVGIKSEDRGECAARCRWGQRVNVIYERELDKIKPRRVNVIYERELDKIKPRRVNVIYERGV
jgi:hypothetical protein